MPSPQLPRDIESLFGDIFGTFFANPDISVTIEASEQEAAEGFVRDVAFERYMPCTACSGRGATDPNAIISVCDACKGAGKRTTTQGFFHLSSACGACNGNGRYVSAPCATCEGRGTTLQRTTQTVTVPPGIAHEQRLRLTGAGSQSVDGTRHDVYITVLIAGRPLSKPPVPTHFAPAPSALPEARVHRAGRTGQGARPIMLYAAAFAIALVVLLAMMK
ncbi:MAG TPA: zinc finger domain-containing protein [Kofleriaceae bacterium]|jgi:molecular chaperone DnaJ